MEILGLPVYKYWKYWYENTVNTGMEIPQNIGMFKC